MSTQEKSKESQIAKIIKSTAYKLKQRQEKVTHGYESAEEIADSLLDSAFECMQQIRKQIEQDFGNAAFVETQQYKNGSPANYIWDTIQREAGDHYKHHSNTNAYSANTYVHIEAEQNTNIGIFFHGIGEEYRGAIACFIRIKIRGKNKFVDNEIFQINHKEPPEDAHKRFEEWLEKSILVALHIWSDSL